VVNNSGGEVKLELVDTRVSSIKELTRKIFEMTDFSTYRFRVDGIDFVYHWGAGDSPPGLHYGPAGNGGRFNIKPVHDKHFNMPDERLKIAKKAAQTSFDMAPVIKAEQIVEG
jgi:hypothetical protein